jgi:glycosyltransferase involved in cell wall biosynthesis
MKEPRVSVIVPLYNKAPYIQRCVESILKQTFADFELIVVDDGSTDHGDEVVRRMEDSRIRLISQTNAGPGAARNRGSDEARGELLAWLDGDDEWAPEYLAESIRLLDGFGEGTACLEWAMIEYPGAVSTALRWNRHGIPEGSYQVSPATPPQLVAAFLAHMLPSSTVMRKWAFQEAGGYYAKDRCVYAEDAYLWLNVLLHHPVAFCSRPLVHKDCAAASLSTNLNGVRPIEPFLLDPAGVVERCPRELKELLRRVLVIRACKTASVYGYSGDYRRARALMREFVRPSDWWAPWFFTAVAASTPAAKWMGGLARLMRLNLRESHV